MATRHAGDVLGALGGGARGEWGPRIAFTDISVTSQDDLFPGVDDVDAKATLQLRAALDAFEEGVFEYHARAHQHAADAQAEASKPAKRRTRREQIYASRIPEDRQFFRPVEKQSAEWAAFKPHLWLRGRQVAAHPHAADVAHALHHPPLPHALSSGGTHKASGSGAAPASSPPEGGLEVVGAALPIRTLPPGAEPPETVLAAQGQYEEVFAVQYDEQEAHVPAALRQRRGRPRDEKAVAVGLPPMEPRNAVLYDVAETLLPKVWALLAPVLAPTLARLAAERRERPATSSAAAFRGGGGGGDFEILTFSSEEEADGGAALVGGSNGFEPGMLWPGAGGGGGGMDSGSNGSGGGMLYGMGMRLGSFDGSGDVPGGNGGPGGVLGNFWGAGSEYDDSGTASRSGSSDGSSGVLDTAASPSGRAGGGDGATGGGGSSDPGSPSRRSPEAIQAHREAHARTSLPESRPWQGAAPSPAAGRSNPPGPPPVLPRDHPQPKQPPEGPSLLTLGPLLQRTPSAVLSPLSSPQPSLMGPPGGLLGALGALQVTHLGSPLGPHVHALAHSTSSPQSSPTQPPPPHSHSHDGLGPVRHAGGGGGGAQQMLFAESSGPGGPDLVAHGSAAPHVLMGRSSGPARRMPSLEPLQPTSPPPPHRGASTHDGSGAGGGGGSACQQAGGASSAGGAEAHELHAGVGGRAMATSSGGGAGGTTAIGSAAAGSGWGARGVGQGPGSGGSPSGVAPSASSALASLSHRSRFVASGPPAFAGQQPSGTGAGAPAMRRPSGQCLAPIGGGNAKAVPARRTSGDAREAPKVTPSQLPAIQNTAT